MFSTIPAKPKKARETIDAAMRVMGSPFIAFGEGQFSILERTPAKSTIARRKPRPTPSEDTIDSMKLNPSVTLLIATPRTAQLVVIRGRYTPSDL